MIRHSLLALVLTAGIANAQAAPTSAGIAAATAAPATSAAAIRDELLGQFDASMEKFIALANAMPAERFAWAPTSEVMQAGHVYAHVAHYNYSYPALMGVAVPAAIGVDTLEGVRDKARVVALLEQSAAHVRRGVAGMSPQDLAATTRLYGREVPRWAVLVQLVAHMNEHLGQSIAYARMAGVTPPWSR